MFYLTTHSTHFINGYMASDIWLRTILIVRKETRCRHIGYSYRLTARVLLYAPSHRQDNTYHGLCYTSWSTGWNEKYVVKHSFIHSFMLVFHDLCKKNVVCYPVYGMIHIKNVLLLIGTSSPCGGIRFPLAISVDI